MAKKFTYRGFDLEQLQHSFSFMKRKAVSKEKNEKAWC
jgi:hypothetical protein